VNLSVLNGQKLVLVDAIGAGVSVLSLLIPYTFEELFGMPKSVVRVFIGIAIFCAIYSTTVYLSNTANWRFYLSIVAIVNLAYCLFTVYHVLQHASALTLIGVLYFVTEVLIILTLAVIELRVSRTPPRH